MGNWFNSTYHFLARNAIAFQLDSENFKPKSPADFLGTDMEQAQKLADLARRTLCQDIETRRALYASLHLDEAALKTTLPAAAHAANSSVGGAAAGRTADAGAADARAHAESADDPGAAGAHARAAGDNNARH